MEINLSHLDYEKNKRFDFELLRNNMNYSDVIFELISHKCINIRDNSSTIALITSNPEEYPKLLIAMDSHGLKLTKQSFKKCLENTQYYKKMSCVINRKDVDYGTMEFS